MFLKTSEAIFLQIDTSDPRDKVMKWSTLLVWGSKVKVTLEVKGQGHTGGQRSRSHDTEVKFGDLAEPSFLTPLVE